ncbi:glycosyltransferase [Cylindrospermum sp. FACHB-282]|uniref:glycosyltransferase n=1 Tax=Cylindrospermum sp. FACHB-282 TaxID=2692794 RepID=UPI0016890168|nr:glycosyltransferase [Cylindrospermum sp. FACHB-282]MBD2388123.1 glycosyltransferase [Cylindrospermum sp. FACHB-282]
MKVLLIHNQYQLAGGEDGVVRAEKSLLSANGNEVSLLEVSNHDIKNSWDKVTAAVSAIYSYSARERVSREIAQFRPDIVHVHNFFPLLSPSIYDACQQNNTPIVQTLHNYRLACPKAMPFRDGKVCEDCFGKTLQWSSVVHGCYRNSRIESSVVAAMNTWHRLRGTWQERVDAYIVFTQFQKDKMVQAGLPADKIYIKPNFVFAPDCLTQTDKRSEYLLFVGRLSEEKGVSVLIDAYIQSDLNIPLKIVGDGPLHQTLEQKVIDRKLNNTIEFLGFQNKQTVLQLMYNAKCLIFPSIWYEGFPLTIAEAFACGLPVIAPKLGGMSEIVEDGLTGLHFIAGNSADLAAKINWAINHPENITAMSHKARSQYEIKYDPESNYKKLMEIYEKNLKINFIR